MEIYETQEAISENEKTIFIQIASYRDPQLLSTLRDCIFKAAYPERLRFGITWQHSKYDQWDHLHEFKDDKRFRIIDIDYTQSKGACWARNLLQQEYRGEDYTLQLDSHHRFITGWDSKFIDVLNKIKAKGHKKPILTTYLASYDPLICKVPNNLLQVPISENREYADIEHEMRGRGATPWIMLFDRFIPQGVVFFLPQDLTNWKEQPEEFMPARFYSAHFCFADGSFAKEVQHDPEYYFHGEEISITVRAYTHGYDLFHPTIHTAWHEYTRTGRTKHWDDHCVLQDKLNRACHERNRVLFGMDGRDPASIDFGKYGFGTERTLKDYERYAGISFSQRAIQPETANHINPPNPVISDEEWENRLQHVFRHCLDVSFDSIPEEDYDVFAIAFYDKEGGEMIRLDANREEIIKIKRKEEGYGKIWRQFYTKVKPYKWLVWPHSVSKGWCTRIEGIMD